MRGVVAGLSRDKLRAAVIAENGYVVFDMHDLDVSIGDEITGNLDDHGDQHLSNQTTGHTFDAYIEAIHATKESARSLLASR